MDNNTWTDANLVHAIGLPGYEFDVIHMIGIITLSVSIVISSCVLIYIRPGRTFFSWPIGDRIVVYLAICDLLYSLNAIADQIYMLVIRDHTPEVPCIIFAFVLNQAIISQSLVVIFAAVNAFLLVVKREKLKMGRFDWRLLVSAFGSPAVLGALGVSGGHFGPSGAWCYIDQRKPLGTILYTALTLIIMSTLVIMVVCYAGIWLKIRQVAHLHTGTRKYYRTARCMMVFVVVYILQWWPAVLYVMWGVLKGVPPTSVILTVLVCTTLGGMWNSIAYTYIRKGHSKNLDLQSSHRRHSNMRSVNRPAESHV